MFYCRTEHRQEDSEGPLDPEQIYSRFLLSYLQAGMIRTREDEFFIEPLDQWRSGEHGEEEEEEGEQRHIVYRSSAIIKKPSVSNRTKEDYMRGELSEHLPMSNYFQTLT